MFPAIVPNPATIVPWVKPARSSSAATLAYGSFIGYARRKWLAPTTRTVRRPTTAISAKIRITANAARRRSDPSCRSARQRP